MSSTPRPRADSRRGPRASSKESGSRPRRWLRRILWTLVALFLLGLAGLGVAYAMTDVPKANEVATAQTSVVYYSDPETDAVMVLSATAPGGSGMVSLRAPEVEAGLLRSATTRRDSRSTTSARSTLPAALRPRAFDTTLIDTTTAYIL